MDNIPEEISTKIFSYACRDSGYTGRSLSLVSKHIRTASQTVKLQSISLHGPRQILGFASMLQGLLPHPHLRQIRYLFCDTLPATEGCSDEDADDDLWALKYGHHVHASFGDIPELINWQVPLTTKEVNRQTSICDLALKTNGMQTPVVGILLAQAVVGILKNAGERLELLEIELSRLVGLYINPVTRSSPISLPHLKELTIYGRLPSQRDWICSLNLMPSRELRRLHIAPDPSEIFHIHSHDFFERIGKFAPSLTHIRVSVHHIDGNFTSNLEVALGIAGSDTEKSNQVQMIRLPPTVKKVFVQPSAPPQNCETLELFERMYGRFLRKLQRLNEMDDRFVLLKDAKEGSLLQVINDASDWLDRVDGGEGCWA